MKITSFDQALAYLYSHIPQQEVRKFPGSLGLERMGRLVHTLGDPQEKYQVVHIAGTSGKGSTATISSQLLAGQGLRVGLHLSPHILDIRERVQINNELISQDKFLQYLNDILPAVEEISHGQSGPVTYFEILVALAYYTFWKEKVDVAVIETGMGGLYDGTNVISNPDKIAVITPIGFDHMQILGETLPEIAEQKVGIIHPGNIVILAPQPAEVSAVLEHRIEEKKAHSELITAQDVEVKSISEVGTLFADKRRQKERSLGLIGVYQAANAMLALEVVYQLSHKKLFDVSEERIDTSLRNIHISARFDIMRKESTTLIIDGAHNEQKMQAFLESLSRLYPNEKFTFLLAFKHGKDIQTMIAMIEALASEIVVTEFSLSQDMLNLSESAEIVAGYVKDVPVKKFSTAQEALNYVQTQDTRVVVTGSLYFASEVYRLL